jgi:hypothetical protein
MTTATHPGYPRPVGALPVDGRPLEIENLDRVLYPAAGTTKAEAVLPAPGAPAQTPVTV